MTTVACDGRTMSSDSRGCIHTMRVTETSAKIFKSWDGQRLIGIAGEVCSTRRYAKWLARPRALRWDAPRFNGDVIELLPDGRLMSHQSDGTPLAVRLPFAIGSGKDLAVGAMLAGASAERAVAIAAERDVYTGGAVVTCHAPSASVGRNAKRQDGETRLGPKGEHAVGEAETPKA